MLTTTLGSIPAPVAVGGADAALRLSGVKSPSVATVAKTGGQS